jgi:flagellar protein FliL
MSAAAAAEAPPPAKGKKKLIIIIAAVVLALVAGGVGFMMMSKKKADAEEGAEDGGHAAPKAAPVAKHDPKAPPVFVPLEPFTVNLADRDAERFAQVGITLEFSDPKMGEQVKLYMPAIRNNVLMAIADRTAGELLGREGKDKLARKVAKEATRALGYEVDDDDEEEAADEHGAEAKPGAKPAPKKKKKKRRAPESPVKAVHFSNFIVQ